tara:strand:- start:537 stop:887 length:351 start_codon:yes stop_codon:yes gene_type:complete
MKITKIKRSFKVKNVNLSHVANVKLKNNNFVTFLDGKKQIDFTKKNWGYYPFPSINSRLKKNFYKAVLVMNRDDKKFFILLVNKNKILSFKKYLKINKSKIVMWFDEKGLRKLTSK